MIAAALSRFTVPISSSFTSLFANEKEDAEGDSDDSSSSSERLDSPHESMGLGHPRGHMASYPSAESSLVSGQNGTSQRELSIDVKKDKETTKETTDTKTSFGKSPNANEPTGPLTIVLPEVQVPKHPTTRPTALHHKAIPKEQPISIVRAPIISGLDQLQQLQQQASAFQRASQLTGHQYRHLHAIPLASLGAAPAPPILSAQYVQRALSATQVPNTAPPTPTFNPGLNMQLIACPWSQLAVQMRVEFEKVKQLNSTYEGEILNLKKWHVFHHEHCKYLEELHKRANLKIITLEEQVQRYKERFDTSLLSVGNKMTSGLNLVSQFPSVAQLSTMYRQLMTETRVNLIEFLMDETERYSQRLSMSKTVALGLGLNPITPSGPCPDIDTTKTASDSGTSISTISTSKSTKSSEPPETSEGNTINTINTIDTIQIEHQFNRFCAKIIRDCMETVRRKLEHLRNRIVSILPDGGKNDIIEFANSHCRQYASSFPFPESKRHPLMRSENEKNEKMSITEFVGYQGQVPEVAEGIDDKDSTEKCNAQRRKMCSGIFERCRHSITPPLGYLATLNYDSNSPIEIRNFIEQTLRFCWLCNISSPQIHLGLSFEQQEYAPEVYSRSYDSSPNQFKIIQILYPALYVADSLLCKGEVMT